MSRMWGQQSKMLDASIMDASTEGEPWSMNPNVEWSSHLTGHFDFPTTRALCGDKVKASPYCMIEVRLAVGGDGGTRLWDPDA